MSKVQPYQQELALLKCQFRAQSRSMDTTWSSDFRVIPADALVAAWALKQEAEGREGFK